ncbi:Putative peptidoglycan binding domain-containing protein [Streptomyces sp. 3213]|uniref:peptidoglycan-binding domain-containing protein n=1 Tax=Streptomyces sp. 3213.3 TaxID=1855348 RepID=UPI0008963F16|nr:peptidoglycan-binding domain-containing protein [Streptomyces sp. 3213.3]SEC59616.1 Putative peptidoglycan binding domain-containing protein [Streptomyces sp. 3213] [Streptomyces sp. 3213.3]
MSTPPEPGASSGGPVLEPARVLRRRRSDNLAELMRDTRRDSSVFESVPLTRPFSGSDDETQELPPVHGDFRPVPSDSPFGLGLRRAAITVGVSAAALVGFACALLLPARGEASTAQPVTTPTPMTSATATGTGTADPDGAGTLREGDSGPEVTELEQRLLRIPNVYENGSTSGQFDATLREAVARFQLWYGIRGDENGVYGDDTRKDLESRTTLDGQ